MKKILFIIALTGVFFLGNVISASAQCKTSTTTTEKKCCNKTSTSSTDVKKCDSSKTSCSKPCGNHNSGNIGCSGNKTSCSNKSADTKSCCKGGDKSTNPNCCSNKTTGDKKCDKPCDKTKTTTTPTTPK